MEDTEKTKEQLIEELAAARARFAELEAAEAECRGMLGTLQESEERYRSMVENIDIGLSLIDCDHNIVMANAAQGRRFGRPSREMFGKKCFQEFEDRDVVCPHCPAIQAIATGRPAEVENYSVIDNVGRFMRLRVFPCFGPDGTVNGFIEIAQDITEVRKATDALRESEERYRAISDGTTVAILLHKEGITIDANRAFLALYGYSDLSELLGKNSIELTVPLPEDREKIYQSIKTGEKGPYEVMGSRAEDGTLFPVEITASEVHLKGELVRVVSIVDITKRKQAEEERARLQREVIEAQKLALRQLSTPVIPVMEHIIVMPLIGAVDSQRAQQIIDMLLEGVTRHRARVVILDITGVPVVDTSVANYLLQATGALRLVGAECVLVGITPEVAQTLVGLGVDLKGLVTRHDLQGGVEFALRMLDRGTRSRKGTRPDAA